LIVLAHEVLGLRDVAKDAIRPASGRRTTAAGEFDDPRGVVTLLDPDQLLQRLCSGSVTRHAS
jgi:hypothetical protein